MASSLLAKTLIVLGVQLLITFGATWFLIDYFRMAYRRKQAGISAVTNEDGELDLVLEWSAIAGFFYPLLFADIAIFLVMLLADLSNSAQFMLFSVWSILTGFELAVCLLAVDENLGLRVLRLTAGITFVAALIGLYGGVNFSSLGAPLFIALSILCLWNLISCFRSFSNRAQMIGSIAGAGIFTLYLIFDFNRLALLEKAGAGNDWHTAIERSIGIYLDIINLFLELLNILSKSSHHS